jgi:hypothetical protein
MADVSKMVSDRLAITRTVVSSIEVHGAEVSDALEKILFPDGPPAHLTVAMVLTALGASLQRSANELRDADLVNAAELADDDAPRAARDQGIINLRARLISIRGTLSSVFGNAVLSAYGLAGETPEDADLLVHRATNAADLLAKRPLVEPPTQSGVAVDAVALGLSLEKPITQLTSALADVKREEREAQLTLKARNAVAAAWNTRYQGIADTATGIYEAVGQADLADRVRPTARRRAGVAEAVDLLASPPAEPGPKG